jgi:hypothetical protein
MGFHLAAASPASNASSVCLGAVGLGDQLVMGALGFGEAGRAPTQGIEN